MGVFQLASFQSFLSVIMVVVVLHSSKALHFIALHMLPVWDMDNVCNGVG